MIRPQAPGARPQPPGARPQPPDAGPQPPDARPQAPGATPQRRVLDVAALPDYAFGHQGLIWWGTIGFMVIEGSMFVMALVTYFFLRTRVDEWPPAPWPNPDATLGTVTTILLLVSVVPALLAKRAAEELDVGRVKLWMLVSLAFGVSFTVVRAFEFGALGVRWDSNAYGSIVWVIMAIHTIHVVTDVADSAVITALAFTGHMEPTRMVDVSETSLYWVFIVVSWIPIYLVIYFVPRWL
jgi:cytochrome c oxidase subunit 3